MTTRVDEAARLPDLGAALDKLPAEAKEYFKQLDYQFHWIIRDFAQRHWALETTVGIVPRKPKTLATGAPVDADYLVKTANASLSAERVVTDTATVTWDWSTPGQAKANASGSSVPAFVTAVTSRMGRLQYGVF